MDAPPLWLLDVDGVLNAITRRPDPGVWGDWRHGRATADGVAWPIWWSPSLTAGISRLHSRGLVEVRWLTTWADQANGDLGRLLGLPRLAVVAAPPNRDSRTSIGRGTGGDAGTGDGSAGSATVTSHGDAVAQTDGDARGETGWWKLRAVHDLVAAHPGRALIWVDDDLPAWPSARAWVRTTVKRHLLLAPNPEVGITPSMLADIEQWLPLRPSSGGFLSPQRQDGDD